MKRPRRLILWIGLGILACPLVALLAPIIYALLMTLMFWGSMYLAGASTQIIDWTVNLLAP